MQITANVLYMLPVDVARSFSGANAIRYVISVLWKMSCFHIMELISQIKTTRMFRPVLQVMALGRSMASC